MPKVYKISLIIFSVLLFAACKDDNHPVPNVPVDFTIEINTPMFIELNAVGNSVIIDSIYLGGLPAGFDNHGIIVYRAGLNEFYAFDRTCTFEQQLDQAVELDELPTDQTAVCPKCGSVYIMGGMGGPNKGPAKYPLRQYHADYSNGIVWVHN